MAKKKVKTRENNAKVVKTLDKYHKFWGIWNFVEALLLLVAGVLCITFAFLSDDVAKKELPNYVAFLVGGFIILDGSLRIITSIVRPKEKTDEDQSIMLIGGFEMTLGICLMIFYTIFTSLIVMFIGVFTLVIGALFILFSILSIARRRSKTFVPIMEILFGAILIGVGIAILVLYTKDDPSTSNKIGLICTGSVLSIAGLAQFIITFIILKKAKKEIIEESEPLAIEKEDKVEVIEHSPKKIAKKHEVIEAEK